MANAKRSIYPKLFHTIKLNSNGELNKCIKRKNRERQANARILITHITMLEMKIKIAKPKPVRYEIFELMN